MEKFDLDSETVVKTLLKNSTMLKPGDNNGIGMVSNQSIHWMCIQAGFCSIYGCVFKDTVPSGDVSGNDIINLLVCAAFFSSISNNLQTVCEIRTAECSCEKIVEKMAANNFDSYKIDDDCIVLIREMRIWRRIYDGFQYVFSLYLEKVLSDLSVMGNPECVHLCHRFVYRIGRDLLA